MTEFIDDYIEDNTIKFPVTIPQKPIISTTISKRKTNKRINNKRSSKKESKEKEKEKEKEELSPPSTPISPKQQQLLTPKSDNSGRRISRLQAIQTILNEDNYNENTADIKPQEIVEEIKDVAIEVREIINTNDNELNENNTSAIEKVQEKRKSDKNETNSKFPEKTLVKTDSLDIKKDVLSVKKEPEPKPEENKSSIVKYNNVNNNLINLNKIQEEKVEDHNLEEESDSDEEFSKDNNFINDIVNDFFNTEEIVNKKEGNNDIKKSIINNNIKDELKEIKKEDNLEFKESVDNIEGLIDINNYKNESEEKPRISIVTKRILSKYTDIPTGKRIENEGHTPIIYDIINVTPDPNQGVLIDESSKKVEISPKSREKTPKNKEQKTDKTVRDDDVTYQKSESLSNPSDEYVTYKHSNSTNKSEINDISKQFSSNSDEGQYDSSENLTKRRVSKLLNQEKYEDIYKSLNSLLSADSARLSRLSIGSNEYIKNYDYDTIPNTYIDYPENSFIYEKGLLVGTEIPKGIKTPTVRNILSFIPKKPHKSEKSKLSNNKRHHILTTNNTYNYSYSPKDIHKEISNVKIIENKYKRRLSYVYYDITEVGDPIDKLRGYSSYENNKNMVYTSRNIITREGNTQQNKNIINNNKDIIPKKQIENENNDDLFYKKTTLYKLVQKNKVQNNKVTHEKEAESTGDVIAEKLREKKLLNSLYEKNRKISEMETLISTLEAKLQAYINYFENRIPVTEDSDNNSSITLSKCTLSLINDMTNAENNPEIKEEEINSDIETPKTENRSTFYTLCNIFEVDLHKVEIDYEDIHQYTLSKTILLLYEIWDAYNKIYIKTRIKKENQIELYNLYII